MPPSSSSSKPSTTYIPPPPPKQFYAEIREGFQAHYSSSTSPNDDEQKQTQTQSRMLPSQIIPGLELVLRSYFSANVVVLLNRIRAHTDDETDLNPSAHPSANVKADNTPVYPVRPLPFTPLTIQDLNSFYAVNPYTHLNLIMEDNQRRGIKTKKSDKRKRFLEVRTFKAASVVERIVGFLRGNIGFLRGLVEDGVLPSSTSTSSSNAHASGGTSTTSTPGVAGSSSSSSQWDALFKIPFLIIEDVIALLPVNLVGGFVSLLLSNGGEDENEGEGGDELGEEFAYHGLDDAYGESYDSDSDDDTNTTEEDGDGDDDDIVPLPTILTSAPLFPTGRLLLLRLLNTLLSPPTLPAPPTSTSSSSFSSTNTNTNNAKILVSQSPLSPKLNTSLVGSLLILIARSFPITERSGVNLRGQFNVFNVTGFYGDGSNSNENENDGSTSSLTDNSNDNDNDNDNDMDDDDNNNTTTKPPINLPLYTLIWTLQKYLSNPSTLVNASSSKGFEGFVKCLRGFYDCIVITNPNPTSNTSLTSTDSTNNNNNHNTSSSNMNKTESSSSSSNQQPVKYITTPHLLNLQLSDQTLILNISIQILIVLSYVRKYDVSTTKISSSSSSTSDVDVDGDSGNSGGGRGSGGGESGVRRVCNVWYNRFRSVVAQRNNSAASASNSNGTGTGTGNISNSKFGSGSGDIEIEVGESESESENLLLSSVDLLFGNSNSDSDNNNNSSDGGYILYGRESKWSQWKEEFNCKAYELFDVDPVDVYSKRDDDDGDDDVGKSKTRVSPFNNVINTSLVHTHHGSSSSSNSSSSSSNKAEFQYNNNSTKPKLNEFLNSYIESLDPNNGIDEEYRPDKENVFTWRAMRLVCKSTGRSDVDIDIDVSVDDGDNNGGERENEKSGVVIGGICRFGQPPPLPPPSSVSDKDKETDADPNVDLKKLMKADKFSDTYVQAKVELERVVRGMWREGGVVIGSVVDAGDDDDGGGNGNGNENENETNVNADGDANVDSQHTPTSPILITNESREADLRAEMIKKKRKAPSNETNNETSTDDDNGMNEGNYDNGDGDGGGGGGGKSKVEVKYNENNSPIRVHGHGQSADETNGDDTNTSTSNENDNVNEKTIDNTSTDNDNDNDKIFDNDNNTSETEMNSTMNSGIMGMDESMLHAGGEGGGLDEGYGVFNEDGDGDVFEEDGVFQDGGGGGGGEGGFQDDDDDGNGNDENANANDDDAEHQRNSRGSKREASSNADVDVDGGGDGDGEEKHIGKGGRREKKRKLEL